MAMLNPYNYKKPKMAVKAKVKDRKNNSSTSVKKEKSSKKDIYLEQKIMAASPEQLTFMLYDGLVRFLKQGKLFLNSGLKDYERVNNSLKRAQAIINELRSTLDMDIEISQSLDLLYDFMSRRTMEANIDKDSDALSEVIGLAEELRDTWKEAIESL